MRRVHARSSTFVLLAATLTAVVGCEDKPAQPGAPAGAAGDLLTQGQRALGQAADALKNLSTADLEKTKTMAGDFVKQATDVTGALSKVTSEDTARAAKADVGAAVDKLSKDKTLVSSDLLAAFKQVVRPAFDEVVCGINRQVERIKSDPKLNAILREELARLKLP